MKKVINGKLYNTETAKCIDWWENTPDRRNFDYCSETLYKKRTGEYFLLGEGGARSEYSHTGPDGWSSGGRQIIPMTIREAKEWAEGHMDADDYMAEFGEVEEGEGRTTLCISIDTAVADRIRKLAAEAGTSVSATIERAFKA